MTADIKVDTENQFDDSRGNGKLIVIRVCLSVVGLTTFACIIYNGILTQEMVY